MQPESCGVREGPRTCRGTQGAPWTGLGVRNIVGVGIDLASLIGARLGCKRLLCGNLSYNNNNSTENCVSGEIQFILKDCELNLPKIQLDLAQRDSPKNHFGRIAIDYANEIVILWRAKYSDQLNFKG